MFNFSYTQEKYDEVKEPLRYYLNWTNIKGNFKYKDCVITVIGMGDERKRIIVRRKIYGESKFLGSKYEVHLMLGFITSKVEKEKDKDVTRMFFHLNWCKVRILCIEISARMFKFGQIQIKRQTSY